MSKQDISVRTKINGLQKIIISKQNQFIVLILSLKLQYLDINRFSLMKATKGDSNRLLNKLWVPLNKKLWFR